MSCEQRHPETGVVCDISGNHREMHHHLDTSVVPPEHVTWLVPEPPRVSTRRDPTTTELNEMRRALQNSAMPSEAPVGPLSPITSREASEWFGGEKAQDAATRVFKAIWDHGSMAVEQIEDFLRMSHQTASARVNQLMNAGFIEDSGRRWRNRSTRMAIIWQPTQPAIEAVHDSGLGW